MNQSNWKPIIYANSLIFLRGSTFIICMFVNLFFCRHVSGNGFLERPTYDIREHNLGNCQILVKGTLFLTFSLFSLSNLLNSASMSRYSSPRSSFISSTLFFSRNFFFLIVFSGSTSSFLYSCGCIGNGYKTTSRRLL